MDILSYLLGKQAGGGGGDTSVKIHNMAYLFYLNNRIDQLNDILSICDEVTNLSHTFDSANSMVTVDLSKINLADSVYSQTDNMFRSCTSLTTVNLSNLITNKITGLTGMFTSCTALTNINFSGCDFSKVTSISSMFAGCSVLKTLDLSMFDNSSNTTNVQVLNAFQNCTAMEHLDMRNFMFTKTSFGTSMFPSGFPTNCEIIVKDSTQKQWFATNYSSFTNVKTVEEL